MFVLALRGLGYHSLSTFQRCKLAVSAHCLAQESSSPGSDFAGVRVFPYTSFPNDHICPCTLRETYLQSTRDVVLALTWGIAPAESLVTALDPKGLESFTLMLADLPLLPLPSPGYVTLRTHSLLPNLYPLPVLWEKRGEKTKNCNVAPTLGY